MNQYMISNGNSRLFGGFSFVLFKKFSLPNFREP